MKRNPIQELQRQGQRLRLDDIRRALITSGELQRLIDEGLTGITSNPTIFEKAISGSGDYDAPMQAVIAKGKGALEIIDASGDLTRRKLIPALFHLFQERLLPPIGKADGEEDDRDRRRVQASSPSSLSSRSLRRKSDPTPLS